jgi:hypothetical protein
MMRAVQALVHGGLNADEAYQMYNDLKAEGVK